LIKEDGDTMCARADRQGRFVILYHEGDDVYRAAPMRISRYGEFMELAGSKIEMDDTVSILQRYADGETDYRTMVHWELLTTEANQPSDAPPDFEPLIEHRSGHLTISWHLIFNIVGLLLVLIAAVMMFTGQSRSALRVWFWGILALLYSPLRRRRGYANT